MKCCRRLLLILVAFATAAAVVRADEEPSKGKASATTTITAAAAAAATCDAVDAVFAEVAQANGVPEACQCFAHGSRGAIWLGCTAGQQQMKPMFESLARLNDSTEVERFSIWNSLLNVVPPDMFQKIRVRELQIERSSLSSFSNEGAFRSLKDSLRSLVLRHNIVRSVGFLKDLPHLRKIDLSSNKIQRIEPASIGSQTELVELALNKNDLVALDDGTFEKLSQLKVLTVANNALTKITKNTFAGLVNLEELYLQHNALQEVDWSAFQGLKNLKILNLGYNNLTHVQLSALPKLKKLYLNNNRLEAMRNVSLKNLPALEHLWLDRNEFSTLDDGDLAGLADSKALNSLSFAGNKIVSVGDNALADVAHVKSLSFQGNSLTSLTSPSGKPWLAVADGVESLMLAGNDLAQIEAAQLPTQVGLLSLESNRIEKISVDAFASTPNLKRLYLNNNRLQYLPVGIFDSLSADQFEAVDLSNNEWLCSCDDDKWLVDWVEALGDRNLASRSQFSCPAQPCDSTDQKDGPNAWITAGASLLAVVSLLLLVAIAILYIEDGSGRTAAARMLGGARGLQRHNSDLLRLINENHVKEPLVERAEPSQDDAGAAERKRVRFDSTEPVVTAGSSGILVAPPNSLAGSMTAMA